MKNFNDISALRSVLREVSEKCPCEQRQAVFAHFLEQQLEFTKDQASLYASTVLTRNAEGSADWVVFSAIKVTGTWMRMEQEGMAAGWLKSVTEPGSFPLISLANTNTRLTRGTVRPLDPVIHDQRRTASSSFGRPPISTDRA